jgi:uncharacterized protein (DUF885 family)
MKKLVFVFLAAAALGSCQQGNSEKKDAATKVAVDDSLNTSFKEYSEQFITSLWEEEPEWATELGYHKYDSILNVPDAAARAKELAFVQTNLEILKNYAPEKLTASHQTDLELIRNYLESKKWSAEQLKEYEWNPSVYNITGLFAFMLTENYAPLSDRLKAIHKRMDKVPAYYATAIQQVLNPVPELQALAIDQNLGGLSVFEKDLADSVRKANLPQPEKDALLASTAAAVKAIKGYVAFLQQLRPAAPRSFRLGKELYDQKFRFDIQSALSAEQMYDSAVARKTYLHSEMAKISRELWKKYFGEKPVPQDQLALIGKMIDTLSTRHVKPKEFQTAIEKQIPELVKFIKDKNLLYIDPSKPLVVRKEPAYMAGVAGASISSPGPYDKGGNTYYNVGSLEGWPAERAESYLREYNHYILQILNIHEAIPGHYTQLVYANRSPSLVKSILGNGAMIEGWAVYTEQMMLENGYGNNEPEMWLMWYKWNLRTVCNTILDYSVHVKNMSREEALTLLTKEAFQQKAEAEGKWKRVNVTSVQLTSYYSGYKEIYDLREAIRKKEGKRFDLRVFHEKFLSYGNAPVKYIRGLMLNQ